MDLYKYIFFDIRGSMPVKTNFLDIFYILRNDEISRNWVHLTTNRVNSYEYWYANDGLFGKKYTFLDIHDNVDIHSLDYNKNATIEVQKYE